MNSRLIKYSVMIYNDELGKNGNVGNIYIYICIFNRNGFSKNKMFIF